ncbi:MAG: hypothetical protein M1150_01640 [Patescibacteria group bacterium]|nr:hypothetical protein [Patescibacteria group bacterium]
MERKILLATTNLHKQEKLKWVVEGLFKTVDRPKRPCENEEGGSFEEIAKNKALEYGKDYDGFVIATDAGMEIPALGSWNSLLTKRFVGKEDATDFDRMDTLLEITKDLKDRSMIWKEAAAIAYKGKIIFSTTVEGARGVLQTSYDPKKYKDGIWLCSLWYFPRFKKNYFDLKDVEVDFAEISWHRIQKAVQNFFKVPYKLRLEQETL